MDRFIEKQFVQLLEKLEREPVYSSMQKPKKVFRIMVYQFEFAPFFSAQDAYNFLSIRLKEISRYSPNLVIMPRFFGNLFYGFVPFSKRKLKKFHRKFLRRYYEIISSWFNKVLAVFAQKGSLNLFGGTLYGGDKERIYIKTSEGVLLTSESESFVFDVNGVKISYVVPGLLKTFWTARKLQESGVKLIITSESMETFDPWEFRKGIWARSQSIGIFGVNSVMVGKFLGGNFEGISFISAPAILTKNGDGFIVKLSDPKSKGIAVADIDFNLYDSYYTSQPKTYRKYWSFV